MLRTSNLKSSLATGAILAFMSAAACASGEAAQPAATADAASGATAAAATPASGTQAAPGTPNVKDPIWPHGCV
ncbi:hypothetical protein ACFQI9_04510 [Paraburkholderia dipogonis]|uniref:hypothetical protein n=1 Tax=Paraburkholderia dipogonis TaxID=1211383 RepID=UPI0036216B65